MVFNGFSNGLYLCRSSWRHVLVKLRSWTPSGRALLGCTQQKIPMVIHILTGIDLQKQPATRQHDVTRVAIRLLSRCFRLRRAGWGARSAPLARCADEDSDELTVLDRTLRETGIDATPLVLHPSGATWSRSWSGPACSWLEVLHGHVRCDPKSNAVRGRVFHLSWAALRSS